MSLTPEMMTKEQLWDTIEALRGEVERLDEARKSLIAEVRELSLSQITIQGQAWDNYSRAEKAEAEAARLKGALDALSAVRSDLPEKVSEGWLYEGVRHWHRNCDWDDPTDGAPLDRGDGATVAKLINMIPRKALAGEAT